MPSKLKIYVSKESTVSKVYKIENENIRNFLRDFDRNIQVLLDIISKIESIRSLDQSLYKLSSLDTPILKSINDILYSDLSNYDKQIAIEKSLIEYELDFFNKNKDTPGSRNKVLHKVYPYFEKGYRSLINDYSNNKYFKIKKNVQLIKNMDGRMVSLVKKNIIQW